MSAAARLQMIDSQIRPADVTDARILAAFEAVAREGFVPTAARALAYADVPVEVAPEPLHDGATLVRQAAATGRHHRRRPPFSMLRHCATGYSAAHLAGRGLGSRRVVAVEQDRRYLMRVATTEALATTTSVVLAQGRIDRRGAGGSAAFPTSLWCRRAPSSRTPETLLSPASPRAMPPGGGDGLDGPQGKATLFLKEHGGIGRRAPSSTPPRRSWPASEDDGLRFLI